MPDTVPPPPPPHVFDAARLREAVFTPARYSLAHKLQRFFCSEHFKSAGKLHCAVVSSSCRRFGMSHYSIILISEAAANISRPFPCSSEHFLALQLCIQMIDFLSSPKRPYRIWGAFNGHRGFSREGGRT